MVSGEEASVTPDRLEEFRRRFRDAEGPIALTDEFIDEMQMAMIERDNLRKMLDDAHALAEIQIRIITGLREELRLKPDEPMPMCRDPLADVFTDSEINPT
jgi:hypothetical protein